MKMLKFMLFTVLVLTLSFAVFSKDVYVKGYYRKDGTYVRPHVRSSPDKYKWNNYGPSRTDDQLLNPKMRDNDNDGIPNYLDKDDDNDGIYDEKDNSQYGRDD